MRGISSGLSFPKEAYTTVPTMARAMVGTAVYAAEGKFPPEAVADILAGKNRTAAGPTAPPGGLYMTRLWYDDGKAVFHIA